MKKRIVIISSVVLTLGLLSSCFADEKKGEEQTSDVASAIANEVEEEIEEPAVELKKEPEEKKEFEYNTNKKKDYLVTITTEFGDIQMVLFDETIEHKKNFIQLASEGFYNGTAFHRVMNDFMIQGGDPNSKGEEKSTYGTGGPGYTIPAEFNPKYIHRKGALAAARTGGPSNPDKESSGSQFYIVEGKIENREQLIGMRKQKFEQAKFEEIKRIINLPENKTDLDAVMKFQQERNQAGIDGIVAKYSPQAEPIAKEKFPPYTEEQLKIYETEGGTPFLDLDYTVYGQVVKGLDVVDEITKQPVGGPQRTAPNDKVVMTVTVELLKKKKITKQTGYSFE